MKERPILFSAPMVRALLAGTKTQTRRVIKPRHLAFFNQDAAAMLSDWNERPLPYGKTGDRLWVRETWHDASSSLHSCALYRADGIDLHWDKWTPSIHMPRWASRITLEITSVRVETLGIISHEDALAEGVSSIEEYKALWININGAWLPETWVWVVDFRMVLN